MVRPEVFRFVVGRIGAFSRDVRARTLGAVSKILWPHHCSGAPRAPSELEQLRDQNRLQFRTGRRRSARYILILHGARVKKNGCIADRASKPEPATVGERS